MWQFIVFLLLEIGTVHLTFSMTPDMKGRDFLVCYYILWFLLLIFAKYNSWKMLLPTIIFLSVGAARFIAGQASGMSRFTLMWGTMFVGVIMYIVIGNMQRKFIGIEKSSLVDIDDENDQSDEGYGGGYGGGSGCEGSGYSGGGGCGGCGGN